MSERLKLLIEEKIYQLRNDIDKEKIEAKTMAEFAVVFYDKYENSYNEQLLVQLCKRTMNFYNESLKNLPDENREFLLNKLTNGINKIQERLKDILQEAPTKTETNFDKKDFDLEVMESRYKTLTKELEKVGEKKPFILFRKKWKRNLENINQQLNDIKGKIESYILAEQNSEKNRALRESFKNIMEDLKNFSIDINPEIGVELATITYEDAIKNKNQLKSYVYDVVIANLYKDFIDRASV